MKKQKESFLERLTGTRVVADEPSVKRRGGQRTEENILSEKPWSPRVDDEDTGEEDERTTYTKSPPMGSRFEAEEGGDESDSEEASEDGDEEAGLAIDMYETDNELIIQSMIAGVMPENLHITITRGTVTLSGKRIPPHGIPEGDYSEQELYWGKFSRDITLPFEIDTDGAEAVEKYGLLIIRLPKLDTRRTQELKVKSIQ